MQESETAISVLTVGKYILNKPHRTVRLGSKIVELSPQKFTLLWAIMAAQGVLVTKDQLYTLIHEGKERPPGFKGIDVQLCQLKKEVNGELGGKIEKHLQTVWGHGYRSSDEPNAVPIINNGSGRKPTGIVKRLELLAESSAASMVIGE